MDPDRSQLLAEAESLLRKSNFTKEDASRVENLIRLADACSDKSQLRHALLEKHGRELGLETRERTQPENAEFRSYLMYGNEADVTESSFVHGERALAAGTEAAGGYLVPASFADRFETVLCRYDQLFAVATLFETATGRETNFPILDDVANAAAIVGENTLSTAGPDLVFAALGFNKCPQWRSGLVRASVELVNDAAFNLSDLIAGAFAVRIARGVGANFITSLLSQAALGKTAAGATAITGDEIFDLVDSVDPEYSANGSFLMRRATLTSIMKLKGSTGGAYLFEPDQDAAGRPLLLGFPVYLSPSMGPMTTGQKSLAFGDLSKFIRRQVKNSFVVKTYVERYAEYGQIAYEGFLRIDGGLCKGSNVPIKFLQQA